MSIAPPDTTLIPPVPSDIGGLQAMTGASPVPPGDIVRQNVLAKLRPVVTLVGDLVNYLIENPEVAPAAKSLINIAFGASRGLRPKRERGIDALSAPPLPPLPVGAALPPLPPAPIPGLPMAPTLRNRMSLY